jgi:Mg2+-importing ATPase
LRAAAIIATMVLLSVAINFFQTFCSQRAADRLRAQVTPKATVLRDGAWREVWRRCRRLADAPSSQKSGVVHADALST